MAATVHSINSQINVIFFINGKTEIALFACNICYPFLCHTCIAEWTYRDHYPLLSVLILQLLLNHQLKHDLLRCCRVMGFCS